jgi:hypothetical protein
MKQLICILFMIIALTSNNRCYAQVTIGVDENPSKGSLLQLKDQSGVTDGNLPNASKGFSLPRVALSVRDKLYPMFGTDGSPSSDYTGNEIGNVDKEHVGMLVYNTYESPIGAEPNKTFGKGIYIWTGERWENIRLIAPNVLSLLGIENGLTLSNGTLGLGGALTQSATTIEVDAATRDFKIDVLNDEYEAPHGFFIDGLTTQPNSIAVVVDNEGKLGKAQVIPARMAFYQSTFPQVGIAGAANGSTPGTLNSGDYVVVTWNPDDDEITNNLLNFIPDENSFQIIEPGIFEISGMVNYRGESGASGSVIVINATMQVQRAGTSTWEDYSSARGVFPANTNAYRQTLNIPPALVVGTAGDKIRLVVQRPPDTPSGLLGTTHQSCTLCGIVVPYGTKFSKSIKIIAQ